MANCETTAEVERVVGNFFRPRQNIVVPNVSWGLFVHECDLFVLTKNGYGIEVEIKVSRADLIKDRTKSHGHNNIKIKKLFFAIPEKLNQPDTIAHIPERAGIIVVDKRGHCKIIKAAAIRADAIKMDDSKRTVLLRLAYLRYWDRHCNDSRRTPSLDDGLGI